MRDDQPNPAVFIEVPKPISAMSVAEKDLFIEQTLKHLVNQQVNKKGDKSRY